MRFGFRDWPSALPQAALTRECDQALGERDQGVTDKVCLMSILPLHGFTLSDTPPLPSSAGRPKA